MKSLCYSVIFVSQIRLTNVEAYERIKYLQTQDGVQSLQMVEDILSEESDSFRSKNEERAEFLECTAKLMFHIEYFRNNYPEDVDRVSQLINKLLR